MIKILHYCPGFKYGGIESRLIDWYANMNLNEIQFIVIKLNNYESEKVKELKKLGGKCYDLPPFTLKKLPTHIFQIANIIKKEKPNIVHVHNTETGLFILAIAKMLKIKTRIIHARNTSFHGARNNKLRMILHKISPRFATVHWACSEEAAKWAFGNKYSPTIIKNGIQVDKFMFNDGIRDNIRKQYDIENKTVIGCIGRITHAKNYHFLIKIFHKFHQQNKDSALMIVGDGENVNELIELCEKYKIKNDVIFVGNKENVWDYYMAFDLFVGTSFSEGFGTTAIESQATGLPTILSTGFPPAVEVSPFVNRLELEKGADEWCKILLETNVRERNKNDSRYVIESGYDANRVAKFIENFYFSSLK